MDIYSINEIRKVTFRSAAKDGKGKLHICGFRKFDFDTDARSNFCCKSVLPDDILP